MKLKVITNKPIPKQYEDSFNQLFKNDEPLFIVVGDLNLKGRYAESMMVFTKEKLVAFDECYESGSFSIDYCDIEDAQVKRLYGNAVFKIKMKNGKKKIGVKTVFTAAPKVLEAFEKTEYFNDAERVFLITYTI